MRKLVAAFAILTLLAGCATTQAGPNGVADRDPREGFNRAIWDFNQAVDQVAIRPVTEVYRTVTPRPARRGLSRIISNLYEPFSFINNLLQGNPERALNNLGRFVVNSTIGVGGLADHATALGIEPASEDFGQTLAVWGVGDGGYVVLPLLGPSTLRDGFGTLVGQFANPYRIALNEIANPNTAEQIAITATEVISGRSDAIDSGVDAFLETSADPYAAARAAYFARRENAILNYDMSGALDMDGEGATANDAGFEAAVEEMEAETDAARPETVPPE